ncbi:uncharacterized protein LOC136084850 isoform X2 [Hydra vulgaris]|uniref:Uncharacterized protein LOC136084850 isoform X2 n=1 Tax=Hydra vulgaris TaxID=6087 RepID=A0ABM4CJW6_HYDVU
MKNIYDLANQTDTSLSSDAVVSSTSASGSATFDAGLLFHQFLRFLQSTQPSTVPSTSDTVVTSTSVTSTVSTTVPAAQSSPEFTYQVYPTTSFVACKQIQQVLWLANKYSKFCDLQMGTTSFVACN